DDDDAAPAAVEHEVVDAAPQRRQLGGATDQLGLAVTSPPQGAEDELRLAGEDLGGDAPNGEGRAFGELDPIFGGDPRGLVAQHAIGPLHDPRGAVDHGPDDRVLAAELAADEPAVGAPGGDADGDRVIALG